MTALVGTVVGERDGRAVGVATGWLATPNVCVAVGVTGGGPECPVMVGVGDAALTAVELGVAAGDDATMTVDVGVPGDTARVGVAAVGVSVCGGPLSPVVTVG